MYHSFSNAVLHSLDSLPTQFPYGSFTQDRSVLEPRMPGFDWCVICRFCVASWGWTAIYWHATLIPKSLLHALDRSLDLTAGVNMNIIVASASPKPGWENVVVTWAQACVSLTMTRDLSYNQGFFVDERVCDRSYLRHFKQGSQSYISITISYWSPDWPPFPWM